MITDRDFTVKQEQHKDRLNRAERQRLREQINADKTKTTLWQRVSNLVSRHDKKVRAICSTTESFKCSQVCCQVNSSLEG